MPESRTSGRRAVAGASCNKTELQTSLIPCETTQGGTGTIKGIDYIHLLERIPGSIRLPAVEGNQVMQFSLTLMYQPLSLNCVGCFPP